MILGLESSCDETAIALFDAQRGLIGEWVQSQIALHDKHGGVVPDLATREHLRNFAPLLERAKSEFGFAAVDQVAVTSGPGLAACLAIGVAAADCLKKIEIMSTKIAIVRLHLILLPILRIVKSFLNLSMQILTYLLKRKSITQQIESII